MKASSGPLIISINFNKKINSVPGFHKGFTQADVMCKITKFTHGLEGMRVFRHKPATITSPISVMGADSSLCGKMFLKESEVKGRERKFWKT